MDRVDSMNGITISPLKIIKGDGGNVMHALKKSDSDFVEFGEVYFSTVENNHIKGWKKHSKMISNLIVPNGEVQFVFYDDREESNTKGKYFSIDLSQNNYKRITASPGLWMAFKGIGESENIVMNFASIEHDPKEAENDLIERSNLKYPL